MSVSPPDNDQLDFFNYTDSTLTTSISQAILQNNKDTLLRLLKKRKRNPRPVPADNRNWTVLHVAASRPQYKDCLKLLLEYKDSVLINLSSQTFEGETALHIACKNGCHESVEILLQNGCDPNLRTLEGDSVLHTAVAEGNLKIVEYLSNRTEIIQLPNAEGLTALHLSALYGHLEISRVLLDKGADVRCSDLNCYLPLHLALQNDYFDIVRLLLKSDSTTINHSNTSGITPLMLAVENCNLEDIRFLLENGAKTDVCDKEGRMPLHFAAYRGNVEILQLLLQSTDSSSIVQCASNYTNDRVKERSLHSLTCCGIHSENVECLKLLLSSRLPRSMLEAPHIKLKTIYSPLAYLLKRPVSESTEELLRVLLEHKITTVDEFCRVVPKSCLRYLKFIHPFENVFDFKGPLLKEHYLNLLIANEVTTDYCLRCYHYNSQPFDTLINCDYHYRPLKTALRRKDIEMVKFLVSNSVILEPDNIYNEYDPFEYVIRGRSYPPAVDDDEWRDLVLYLMSLKPFFFVKLYWRRRGYLRDMPSCPLIFQGGFSKLTLKQLCRTAIRHQLREYTIGDNLRHFRRKIMELPLPVSLKEYLLFKN